MSPVNSDDPSGDAFGGAGRPLTRKEIRAQEKSQATQGHDVIPPQAFQTGEDAPPAAPAADAGRGTAPATEAAFRPEPIEPADAPDLPPAAPTVHEEPVPEEPVHEEPEHEEPVFQEAEHAPVHEEPRTYAPVPEAPVPAEPVHEEPRFEEPVHEYAGAAAREDTAPHDGDIPAGHDARHDADFHAVHPADEAQYGYQPADGHAAEYHHEDDGQVAMAGGAPIRTSKGPSKKVRRRRRFLALLLTLSVFVVAVAVGAQFLKPLLGGDKLEDYPGPGTGEVVITVPEGAGPRSVATQLEDKNVVANADTFLRDFVASGGALAPGEFSMRNEMKNSDAVDVLLNKGQDKVMYVALSAGLRVGESLQAISEGTGVPVAELEALNESPAQFGVPAKAKNLEGFLAPGEYRFPLGTPAKDVLQKLVTTTLDELKAQGVKDPAKQYDVVTVASIVQAEGGQAEYGDVAGAIYNRLKPSNTETNGLIQSDATVTYGLGIKSFHIDEEQKADKSNPYNTYANQGLPVGPIGSPGKTAIDAAAKPKKNAYLYWVTINLDTKETLFSKTLAEHNVYVAKYNAWCEANPGRCV
ncbi:endolytic transglycosylase MltG [Arthrobacter sp. Leaf69]|uniref:endolytic transglycosylase MltG n=1 Tax=Arthrobacter sp. Leaf69 TaxID=1736232 RepID=UPI0006FB9891|nr:endolytic transglycosylase MltG [Arthrobacter sp. Leaf69]KQN88637.1 aminodeoxychorismate lyase [Arthrobacter sp. Leaf69]